MPGKRRKETDRYAGVETRVQVFAVLMTAAFCILVYQLWQLQVVQQHEFAEKAESQRMTEKLLKAGRGRIYDRQGAILADNRPSVDVVMVPGECDKERYGEIARTLEELLGVSASRLLEDVKSLSRTPYQPITVKRDVSKADRVRVEEHAYALGPGVFTVVRPQRYYPYGKVGAQLLGHLSAITRREKESWGEKYTMNDRVGRLGLEAMYESLLHGRDGSMFVTQYVSGGSVLRSDRYGTPVVAPRDTLGHIIEVEGERIPPRPGEALHTTLDIGLQAACEEALAGEVGAIVVLEADTGAVLAMASTPTFDPNGDLGPLYSPDAPKPNPLFNRAMRENYPPGSVFKVMMAAAALEEGIIDENTRFYCPGFFQINGKGRRFHCWKHAGHGNIRVVDALAFSCDVFFYNVGLALGIDKLSAWAHKMGLGQKTGIDLPGEITGLIPTREWKARLRADEPVWERNWYPGDTVNVSIGQGSVSATPLQAAVMMACVTNGGWRVRPFLNQDRGPKLSERILSDRTLDIITRGMRKCVEKDDRAPTGTGKAAKIEGMAILGKTGSAQIMSLDEHKQYATEEDIPKYKRDHAWFVAGVIDREPRIALCILVEHGHHGSSSAAPLAKKVIRAFYGETGVPAMTTARAEGG